MTMNHQKAMKPKQKEVSLKMAKTRHIVKDSGLTSFQEGAEKGGITKRAKGRHFMVFNSNDDVINNEIYLRDLNLISAGLKNSSKEKPIGSTTQSRNMLKKCNKEYLIGYYVKEIK